MTPQQILRDAWYFYSRNFLQIALLCGPLMLLEALSAHYWESLSGSKMSMAEGLLVALMFSPLYQAVLIYFMASRSSGEPLNAGQLYSAALRIWPLYALLISLGLLLKGLGLMMLIVPGIWIAVKLSFADYLVVLRRQPPLEALRNSFYLTEGQFWNLLLLSALCLTPIMLAALWVLNPERGLVSGGLTDTLLATGFGLLKLFLSVVLFRYFMLITSATRPD